MKGMLLHRTTTLLAITTALTISVVIAFAPSTWPTMMLRSFLPQWIMLFAVLALLLFVLRRWREGAITACSALLIAPSIGGSATAHATVGDRSLRIAHFNVLQSNEAYDAVIAHMLHYDADVIGVQEVDHAWAVELQRSLAQHYPYGLIEPRTNCYGIALFSRLPLRNARVIWLAASPAIEAVIDLHGTPVRLITVHTSSPGSPGHFAARNAQFDLLAGALASEDRPVVVFGDLNAAPWDKDLQRFLAASGLRTHADPNDPTFPSVAHLALIPIDHVLTDRRIAVRQHSVHVPGSDHRGLVADLSFAE